MSQMLFCYFGVEHFRRPLPLIIYYFSKKYCRRLSLNRLKYIIPSDLFSYYGFVGLMDDRNLERWWTRKQGEKLLGLGAAVIQTVYVGKVRELLWRQHDPTQFNVAIGGFNQIIMTNTSYHQNTPIYHTVNRLRNYTFLTSSGHLVGHLDHLCYVGHLARSSRTRSCKSPKSSFLCFQHCNWL